MLAIDWLGCLASTGALALVFRGRWRILRAIACAALAMAGIVAAGLALTGQVTAITAGGAFTGVEPGGVTTKVVTITGLWTGALFALPLGPRLRRDGIVSATFFSLAILLLP